MFVFGYLQLNLSFNLSVSKLIKQYVSRSAHNVYYSWKSCQYLTTLDMTELLQFRNASTMSKSLEYVKHLEALLQQFYQVRI